MIRLYQVTLFCTTGQYKPVSAIVKKDDSLIKEVGKDEFIRQLSTEGDKKICIKRYWTKREVKRYNYNRIKIREYETKKEGQDKGTELRG